MYPEDTKGLIILPSVERIAVNRQEVPKFTAFLCEWDDGRKVMKGAGSVKIADYRRLWGRVWSNVGQGVWSRNSAGLVKRVCRVIVG